MLGVLCFYSALNLVNVLMRMESLPIFYVLSMFSMNYPPCMGLRNTEAKEGEVHRAAAPAFWFNRSSHGTGHFLQYSRNTAAFLLSIYCMSSEVNFGMFAIKHV